MQEISHKNMKLRKKYTHTQTQLEEGGRTALDRTVIHISGS